LGDPVLEQLVFFASSNFTTVCLVSGAVAELECCCWQTPKTNLRLFQYRWQLWTKIAHIYHSVRV